MKEYRNLLLAALALIFCLLNPSTADAYVGPGSGVTVIGAALSLIGGVLLAIVGFIWYPIKRLIRRSKQRSQPQGADTAAL
jgi:hypothetical protein